MTVPDWRTLVLSDGVLPEPVSERGRLVFWVRGNRVNGYQEWQRISTAARPEIAVEQGACFTAATAVSARQQIRGLLGKLLHRLCRESREPTWVLPNGATAAEVGERQTDLLLVWTEEGTTPVDRAALRSRWPNSANVQQVGRRLFVVHGIGRTAPKAETVQPLSEGSPLQIAEQLLQAARRQTDPGQLVSALTDLGVVLSNDGNCQRAIGFLEEALALVRQIQDRPRECDVLGNLGMALAAQQPARAHDLLQQELALARSINDRYGEKIALNHLGLFYLRTRNAAQAFACLGEALAIARTVGDRQHEADLLWLTSIVHAELGQRNQAIIQAQMAVDLLQAMGKPQAQVLADHLRKFQAGAAGAMIGGASAVSAAVTEGFGSEFFGVGGKTAGPGEKTSGPGFLRMGFTAAKAMARFLGSGMKRVSPDTYQFRQQTCTGCEHHTGLRCKLCGCFTSVKAWLPREECPVKKWAAV